MPEAEGSVEKGVPSQANYQLLAYKKREKEKAKAAKNPSGNGSRNPRPRGNRNTSTTPSGSSGISAPRYGGPTAEEAKKLLLEGRCFVCKEKGHTRATCPYKERLAKEHDAKLQSIADRYVSKNRGGTPAADTESPRVTELDSDNESTN
ncbi:hypothetical protein QBC46DRAFT_451522 [Diplogelasinospora grovesii]|uniref:CCHC-type domain-containing protein n=1 Tax=Diplogelasinospora grovesii TaxID=303347 RepID=A0AAN6S1R0_9PEZI|nr:hypothetical protein QBC46DRAFT_451522 [Diplogelasinospora grovesii]